MEDLIVAFIALITNRSDCEFGRIVKRGRHHGNVFA